MTRSKQRKRETVVGIAVNQFTESKAEHNRSFNKEILGHLKSLASIIEKTEDNIPMK